MALLGSIILQHRVLFFTFFLASLVEICQSEGFSAIGAKFIRPSSNYTVALSNLLPKDVRLNITLGYANQNIDHKESRVPRQSARFVIFNIDAIPSGEYWLSIDSLSSSLAFSQRVELEYEAKTMSVFIQPDKPVYKPGDTIRFRVVVVDVDTRPVKSIKTISIELTDAEQNSIWEWPYARLHNGVFESEVKLASAPKLGEWTLTVTTQAGETPTVKHVEVKEYVLPTFIIEAIPSKIILASDKKIPITIKSHYTFGEPVDGIVTVDLYLQEDLFKPTHSKITPITGVTTVVFHLADQVEIENEAKYADVITKIKVLETFSNRTINITQIIPVYRNKFEITLLPTNPEFRPGLVFPVQISVKDHSNQPPSELGTVELKVYYDGSNVEYKKTYQKKIDVKGLAAFKLEPPEETKRMTFNVIYENVEYDTELKEIGAHQSESKQYIKIIMKPYFSVKVNQHVEFEVICTERMSYFSYVVVARGSIIATSNVKVSNQKKYTFKYKLLPVMSPEATIIVFYTNREYVVYDDLVLIFDEFNNNFKIEPFENVWYKPGQEIYVHIHAAKDSYVALQAIDQSVLFVEGAKNSLTRQEVLEDLARYVETNMYDPFHSMGIFFRSTAVLDNPIANDAVSRTRRSTKIPHIRTIFHESWLWENYTMNGKDTKMEIVDTIPDTITSWSLSGFALSPTLGLGVIRHPVKFEVRQPFFLVANLPYSIKRGEVALIKVTVFNFIGSNITTYVTLFIKNEEFEFIGKTSKDPTWWTKGKITPTNSGTPVSFMIKAKKLGQIAIKIQASNEAESDAIEHMLRVTPESHRYENNVARFIDLDFLQTKVFDIGLDIPRTIDDGSVQIKFSLSPDLLGQPIKNLENLIQLPTGCGEQNMISFVPNIVVLDYLTETEIVSEQIKTKAINYLNSGYQNQLKFKRSDGSFSVWGPKDAKGSTFLTAFVAKSLKIASKYITVDKEVMAKAFEWLANNQQSDGQFSEVGSVWHAEMQGGLRSSSYALTSYVLIAFTENDEIAGQYKHVVTKTMDYLAKHFDSITDLYDLALASYGMTLGKHKSQKMFFDRLVEVSIANNKTRERYWDRPPVAVEVAGYALLTYIEHGLSADATPIMRWLNGQRYGLGGFRGTQDTFVGLKALAKLAATLSANKNEYRVRITHKPNKVYTYDITKINAMDTIELNIPDNIRNMTVEISGKGFGFFQVAFQYYRKIEIVKPSFRLSAIVLNTTSYNVQHLMVCVSYIPKEAYQRSNMAFVEVFFPSGMVAEPDAVEDLSENQEITKTELRFAGTSIVVYYNSLGTNSVCFKVTAFRKHQVALQLPAYVVVYDFYDDSRFAIKQYEGKVLQLCDICPDEDCKKRLSC